MMQIIENKGNKAFISLQISAEDSFPSGTGIIFLEDINRLKSLQYLAKELDIEISIELNTFNGVYEQLEGIKPEDIEGILVKEELLEDWTISESKLFIGKDFLWVECPLKFTTGKIESEVFSLKDF